MDMRRGARARGPVCGAARRAGGGRRRARRSAGGSVAVEFALIAPLLIALSFAVIEWSFVLYNKAVLTNAAREGARSGVMYRPPAQRTAGADITAATVRAQAYCNNALISMAGSSSCAVAATPSSGAKASGTDTLTVTTTHTYTGTGLLALYGVIAGPIDLTQRAVMTYE